jgi:cytidylate kinase
MSFKSDSITFTGGNGLARTVREIAKSNDVRITGHLSAGWIVKNHTMSIYGHADDIEKFKRGVDSVVNRNL